MIVARTAATIQAVGSIREAALGRAVKVAKAELVRKACENGAISAQSLSR